MEARTIFNRSVFGLFRLLTRDTRRLLRQEAQLARTEIAEKISSMGRITATFAIGGCIACAGLMVFLFALGWLLAWVFTLAGLEPMLAGFIGLGAIGLLVVIIGAVLLVMSMKTLSHESLKPKRTLHTLKELKSGPAPLPPELKSPTGKPSSEELQTRVEATENRLSLTLDELGARLSPQHINAQVKRKIQAKPYRAGLFAMGAGLISGLIVRRRFRHAG
jgi:hypothetical protein